MDKIHLNWLDDMHLENKILFMQFYQAMINNDINTASDILVNNPQLSNQIVEAENVNELIIAVLTLETQPKIDIDNFLNDLQIIFQNLIDQTKFISEYNNLIKYEKQNFVTYNGLTYFAIESVPVGTIPTNPTYWNEYNIKGLQGYPGVNLNLRYNWNATINYNINDVVIFQNKLWSAINPNINSMPDFNFQNWLIIGLPRMPIKTQIVETAPTNIPIGNLWFKVTSGGSVIQTKWSYMTDMPTARYANRALINGTNIYVLGGDVNLTDRTNINEMYDSITNTWTSKQAMTQARGGASSFVLNNKGYIVGGTQIHGDSLTVNEEYDFITNTWSIKAPLPQPLTLAGFTTNLAHTIGYLFGGGDATYIGSNNIYAYTQSTNTWQNIGSTPISAADVKAYNINDLIYVNFNVSVSSITETETKFYSYNLNSQVWTELESPIDYRVTPILLGYGNYLYLLGGMNIYGYTTDTNQIYNISTNTWSNGVPMQTTRMSFAGAVLGSNLYVFGGGDVTNYTITNKVEKYTI